MEIVHLNIESLKPVEYNPRKINEKAFEQLKKSIKEFDCVEPIIVNSYQGREKNVIGGHQRLKAMKSLGWKKVPCVYVSLDELGEKELNVRLNKNGGEFDFDLLDEFFDKNMLEGIGFDFDTELIQDKEEKEKPELEFTEELLEAHNYVILYFDNEIDWQTAVEKFDISTKKAKDAKGNYVRAGVGRVLRGANYV